jgi:hypothetical protein
MGCVKLLAIAGCFLVAAVIVGRVNPATAQSDDQPQAGVADGFDWKTAIEEFIVPTKTGAFEIRSIELLRALVTNDMIAAVLVVDKSLDGQDFGHTYSGEIRRKQLLRVHGAIPALGGLRRRLATSELVLELTEPKFEFVKGIFWLYLRRDDSRSSADRLALGIVDDDATIFSTDVESPPIAHLTVGQWR